MENSDIWLSSSFCAQATVGFLGWINAVSCMSSVCVVNISTGEQDFAVK